ncbi:MAG: histidine kinase, partial [Ferruginibacter sp.]
WVQWNKGVVSLERNRHGSYISFFTTTGGAFEVDSVNNKIGEQFLAGKKISHTKRDTEGELWFTTLGEGVYKLVSRSIQTITAEDGEDKRSNEVFCIARYGKDILAGCVFSKMMLVDAQKQSKRVLNFEKFMLHSELPYDNNRTYAIKVLKDGAPVVGFDGFLLKLDGQKLLHKTIFPNKSIDEVNDSTILLGTRYGAYLLNSKDLRVMDTVWKHRATKVYVFNDRYYIGTLDGLYEVDKNKKSLYLGEADPALTRRTVDIVSDNSGILWIASSDAGVVGYKEGRIVRRIDEQAGLSSNICKSLFMDKQVLWVGTNKGVNKIRLDNPAEPIRYYSTTDGLPSDIINAIYVEDSIVWLGSPAGLTRFNENRISAFSFCSLKLLNVTVSGENRSIDSSLQLHYRDNNISFAYTAISLKSGKEVKYYYRLKGLNNEWQQTQQNNLYYQSLPAGKYELELYAVNKYGVKSDVIHYSFVIETPYWASWWFYAIIILCVIALTGWLVNRRNQKKRALLEQKNKVQQQFAALEQQALQAQMNPHFIFNCLNSIQQYILTNNKTKANEYLTGFASLIRQTLDNSAKKSITVAEEIRYLSTYLEMEKMRFGDNFTYTLHVDGRINASFLEMPALLLQPYVENAIRHGIRHRETGMGEVDISFELEGEVLICRICDNGIGRQKAIELKSRQHIEYQSKGMSLTGKRIELLNKMDDKHINVTINDLYQPDGTAAGTEVILKIPV